MSAFGRLAFSVTLVLSASAPLSAQQAVDAPPADHVAPPAPEHPMPTMSDAAMTDAMQMDDASTFAMLKFDRLEYADTDHGSAAAWKLSAWVGGDFDKVLLRSEGEDASGEFENADAELLWDHAVAAYWDAQIGVRHDFGRGADRNWVAVGAQGLAPYWFDVGVTTYLGDAGRTALRVEIDYDLALTQRLILQPRLDLNAYGEDDPAARVGSGLSDAALGLRLRYEIRREVAPYVGVEYSRSFGRTLDLVRGDGLGVRDLRWIVGLRVWY